MGLPRASKGHEAIERENTYKKNGIQGERKKEKNKYYGYLEKLSTLSSGSISRAVSLRLHDSERCDDREINSV